MRIAISQPTYLPWMGYFDLIDQVDCFVFLDSVQFEKRSWQQRNRIKGPDGLILLTVPVKVKGRFEQPIAEVTISDSLELRKHQRSIEMSYRNARFFQRYRGGFSEVLAAGWATGSLAELNILLIRWCMQQLSITTPTLRSSEVGCRGKRSELLAGIGQQLQADCYLSALGSAEYLLNEEAEFTGRHIEVRYQHYEHPAYEQQFPPFVPYASVIDALFNLGDRAIEVLRSGRKPSFFSDELRGAMAGQAGDRL